MLSLLFSLLDYFYYYSGIFPENPDEDFQFYEL